MPYPGARKRIRVWTKALNESTDAYDLADPTSLTVIVQDPAGVETTYLWPAPGTITKQATGKFYVDHTCSTDGDWRARAVAAGVLVGVDEASWSILPSMVVGV